MTTAGSRNGGGSRYLRALTAVVALYALVMQVFLGGIAASSSVSAAVLPFDVHCLQKTDGGGRNDPAAPHAPAHHHACCCTAAHPVAGSPPPVPSTAAVVWPQRLAVRLVWRMEGVATARAPPGTLASARAPPSSDSIASPRVPDPSDVGCPSCRTVFAGPPSSPPSL